MRNLLFNISYNGKEYEGYQVQGNKPTITKALQDAIELIIKKRENIFGCSRTDAGVHANNYYFNMKTECIIPIDKLIILMNKALPRDIYVKECKVVDESFHARYNCKGKEYIYKIYCGEKNPFEAGLALHYNKHINVELLNEACNYFIGTHNFLTFCSKGYKKDTNTIKTIYDFNIVQLDRYYILTISGNSFLYNMVRILVGTLLAVNEGKIQLDALPNIIDSQDRRMAGRTVPPDGLYLNKVLY